jgi:hypothetical protein
MSRSDVDQVINWIQSKWEAISDIMNGYDDLDGEKEEGRDRSDRTQTFRDQMDELMADSKRFVERMREFYNESYENNYDDEPDEDESPKQPQSDTAVLHDRLKKLLTK